MLKRSTFAAALAALLRSCASNPQTTAAIGASAEPYDLLIDNGTIYDGSGGAPFVGDVAIKGDRIVYVGPQAPAPSNRTVDASGLAVSPGFINMLSWATETLIEDGRGMSDTVQGVTLEVFGEGASMGPWNEEMKALDRKRQQRHQVRHPLDDARPISRTSGEARSDAQRRLLRRRDDRAHPRARRRRRRSHARAAAAHARARPRRRCRKARSASARP